MTVEPGAARSAERGLGTGAGTGEGEHVRHGLAGSQLTHCDALGPAVKVT